MKAFNFYNFQLLTLRLLLGSFLLVFLGGNAHAQGPCDLLNEDFSTNPTLSATNVDGAWYTDRYAPAAFIADAGRLKISISAADGAQNRPASYVSGFYNTQGRKINQCGKCVTAMKGELYIPSDWQTQKRRSGMWATAFDVADAISAYPIIGFGNVDGASPTLRYWSGAAWVNIATAITYDAWTTFEFYLDGLNIVFKVNGTQVGSIDANGSTYFGNIIMQAFNFNDNTLGIYYDGNTATNSYDAFWDNLSTSGTGGKLVTNTTSGNTYCTIQAAVDDATAGDEVVVSAGTYDVGTIEIDKAITLKGAQAGVTPLKGTRTGGESIINASGTFAIVVKANDVTIDGFEITGFGRDGINVRTFEDAFGAYGAYRNNMTIQYNYIHVNGAGPRNGVLCGEFSGDPARSSASALLNDFVIANNCLSINGVPGVALRFTSHFTSGAGFIEFKDFEIDYNVIEANSTGLFASASPAKFIFNNPKIRCNDLSGMTTGINMGNLNDALVDGNVFSTIGYVGAQIGVVGGSVTHNTFNNIGPSPYWPSGSTYYPSYALMMWGDQYGFPTGSENCEISGNFFNYNSHSPEESNAIRVLEGSDASTIQVVDNHFNDQGAEVGALTINNQAPGILDANCNWWDTQDISVIAAKNAGLVDVSTVLNSGADDQPATKGFQPAGSCDDPCPDELAEQNCNNSGCGIIRVLVCQNDPTPDLEAIIMGGNSGYTAGSTLNWYKNSGGEPGASITNAPNVNPKKAKKRNYWVTQTLNGCESDPIKVRVIVYPQPQPVFNLPGQGCQGGQIELANLISDANGLASSYAVYDQDPHGGSPSPIGVLSASGGNVDAGESLIINLVAGNQSYWVVATSNKGCSKTTMATIAGDATATVDFIPNYIVDAGDAVNISLSGQHANNIVWFDHLIFNNPNIGIIGAQGITALVFTAQNAGSTPLTATIRVIPYNVNCAGMLQDFTITVNPTPARHGQLNSLQLAASLFTGREVSLDWEIVYDQELIQFEVEKEIAEGEFVSIAEVAYTGNGTYNYMDKGDISENNRYRLKLLHADGRIVWSNVVEVGSRHHVTIQEADRFALYPNPTTSLVTIRQQANVTTYQWQLTDVMGKTLRKGRMEEVTLSLDVSDLSAGVYHLVMISEKGERFINRVVKQ